MSTRLALTLAFLLVGCKKPSEDPNRVARSVTSADGDIGVMVEGHNAFSWELYGSLVDEAGGDNLFFSPFSITAALGMTMAGAEGATEDEMRAVLGATSDEAAWHGALGALIRDLNGDFDRGYTLNVANKLFGQEDYPWEEPFLAVCDEDYGAPLEPWDFRADPEGGRELVNDWVEDETNGKIVDLLPQGSVDESARLVLANAIYFLADWTTAFDSGDTRDEAFTKLDDSTVKVPMMHMDTEDLEDHAIKAAWTDDASLLRLPYRDDEVSMILVVPNDEDGLPGIEAQLDAATFEEWTDSLYTTDVRIGMPKLELNTKVDLVPHLEALGMPSAFSRQTADFTGMADAPEDGRLYVSGSYHQAFVKIDEAGTEAAAATAEVTLTESVPMEIIADHPFLFVIRDDLTGAILFVGRVTDPS